MTYTTTMIDELEFSEENFPSIIVNDGSTDETVDIINNLKKKISR